jgi:adenylate cyclase
LPEPDGSIRIVPLVGVVGGKFYPSLPLEMARTILKDQIEVQASSKGEIDRLAYFRAKAGIVANRRGMAEVNFRGPAGSFSSISAQDLLTEKPVLEDDINRKLAGVSKAEILRDAYVLVGATALGTHDTKPTPFDGDMPGLEIHATVLDNLLSHELLSQGSDRMGFWVVLLMMVFGMYWLAMHTKRLEAIPALAEFAVFVGLVHFTDFFFLFPNSRDWNTGFLYLEALTLMLFTLVAKYVAEEEKKKYIRGAFAKYLAPAVVDQIVRDPSSLHLGGTRKPLTILFSDIRGFTTFSERMDAKLLSDFLNDYLGIMTGLVFENRGTLDKYIGDAIMAFWGAPLANGEHALHCCRTAVKMMGALQKNRARFLEKYGVNVNIGVGINTGEVSVGNMGSDASFSYTVIGDSVNLASRLESATKAYGVSILTTRGTLDSVEGAGASPPPYRMLDSVRVKGKQRAVDIVEILWREFPPEALDHFEKGRALYSRQKWDEAIAEFRECDRNVTAAFNEPDGPSHTFITRCETFKNEPPGSDWDGSWEFDSK